MSMTPEEVAYQQKLIQRRQDMAQAMQQQAGDTGSWGNDKYAHSPWEGVAKLVQAYVANKAGKKADMAGAALQKTVGGYGDQAAADYQSTKESVPGFTMESTGQQIGDIPGSPYKAVADAMTNPYAREGLQKTAQMDYTALEGEKTRAENAANRLAERQMILDAAKAKANYQIKTRDVGNGMKQDYRIDPDTGDEKKQGEAYKENPTKAELAGTSAANGLSGDALTNAAERYRQTGTLPSLGMGGASLRVKIINKAAELSALEGDSAKAASQKQQANKAAQAALGQITKQKTVTGAFEKTAERNLDLALQTSDAFNRSGSPLYNKAVIAYRKGVKGDPATARFVNALTAARNEYAKVLSSSTGAQGITDSARKEAEDLFSKSDSHEMLVQTIALAKQEMANRMMGFDDQIKELSPDISATAPTGATVQPAEPTETAAQRYKRLKGG